MQKIKMKMMAVAIGAVVAASFATAQGTSASDARLNVNLKDADLVTATKMVTERTGLQFIFKSSKAFNKITLQLKDQTADDVIRYICDAAGAYVTRDENNVYVITADKPSAEPVPVAATKPKAKIFKKIKLLHAGGDEVFARVVFNRVLDPLSKIGENQRAINLAKQIISPTNEFGKGANALLNSLSNYNSYQPTQNIPNPTLANSSVGVAETSNNGNGITLPGEGGNQRGGGFGPSGGGGAQGPGGGGTQGPGGGQGNGGGAQLQPGVGLVPDTIDHISYDPTDNSLIVRGTSEDDINQLQNIIAQFDIRPRQVQIKVEFITTSENLDRSLGFSVNYARGTVIAGMASNEFLNASDPVFLTYSTGDAVLRLRTRLSEGSGRVVTAPVIRTMNNTPATVFATTQDYILTSQSTLTNGIVLTTVTPIPIQLGTGLSVTPRINADDTITMGLSPQVTNITNTKSYSSNGTTAELPIFSINSIQVVVNVRNKETIVLGGLTAESVISTTNRVPVLSDLPILGQFFKKTTKSRNSNELLIFVTPVILEDEDGGIIP